MRPAAILAFVLTTLLAAQGPPVRHVYRADLKWLAPPAAVAQENPLANKATAAAGGAKLFRRNCAQCHGEEGKGNNGRAPNLTAIDVQAQSDGALFWKITNGDLDYGMPSFSNLPRNSRWQIILHLRQLGQVSAKTKP